MTLEDYEPVAVRLDRWLKANPDGRVITHMVSPPGADVCVFRAELWVGDVLVATGWAEEVRGANRINTQNHVEVCETSSIGRACANAGLSGSDPAKRPSREEMGKAQRYSAAGNGSGGEQRPRTTSTDPASPAQLGKIRAMSKNMGRTPPIGYESLNKSEASQLIEKLIAEQQAGDAGAFADAFPSAQEDPF